LAELIGKGKLQHVPYKNNENYNIVANVSLYLHINLDEGSDIWDR
jgi:hypothetical protein